MGSGRPSARCWGWGKGRLGTGFLFSQKNGSSSGEGVWAGFILSLKWAPAPSPRQLTQSWLPFFTPIISTLRVADKGSAYIRAEGGGWKHFHRLPKIYVFFGVFLIQDWGEVKRSRKYSAEFHETWNSIFLSCVCLMIFFHRKGFFVVDMQFHSFTPIMKQ